MMGTPVGMGSTGMAMGGSMGMGSTVMGNGLRGLIGWMTPTASITSSDINLHRDTIQYKVKISVIDPNLYPLRTSDISYVVRSAGREIASGTKPANPGQTMPNSPITVYDVPLEVPYGDMVRDSAAVGDIDYEVELVLGLDIPHPHGAKITIPFKINGKFKLDPHHP
ncbi:hypothetical protein Tsubulata_029905 [Turnera subulata]|uniref:Late embryogenesis abundant protein LEA-2 subgroup domain-containing protein n=1 Tax=Turnera subulata TaxID=218843 RepID=A0A9Q0FV99_9ROSI|nr:hypothetical protein Tsubulata_029905 [Turnera subulata]